MLAFELKISGIDALKAMAANVRRYPEEAAIAGRDAANSIAKFALVEAANDMSQRYNLQPTYVKELMSFTPAEAGGRAVVSVRNRAIRLARFESRQITVAARLAKGDKLRKIAPGRKQAVVSVKVLRSGDRKTIKGFFIPLNAGKAAGANGMGLFVRTGPGRGDIKHLYGPAPHQVIRSWFAQKKLGYQQRFLSDFSARLQRALKGR